MPGRRCSRKRYEGKHFLIRSEKVQNRYIKCVTEKIYEIQLVASTNYANMSERFKERCSGRRTKVRGFESHCLQSFVDFCNSDLF